MSKKLPLTDFRAVRSMLEPYEFAISEGQDVAPSDLVEPEVWDSIMHLPEDVSIRISDHNGIRLKLLDGLWADWLTLLATQVSQTKSTIACWMPPIASDVQLLISYTATIGQRSPNYVVRLSW